MNDALKEYRKNLVETQQKSENDFSQTIIKLSGGALGVTFAFIKDIIGTKPVIESEMIFYAWISWAASLAVILMSFYFSSLGMRKATDKVDTGKIYEKGRPGGWFDYVVELLNPLGSLFFIAGVFFAARFVYLNL